MKIQTRFGLVLLAMILIIQPVGLAQAQDSTITVHVSWVDTTQFPTITVHFSAWDAAGLPLADLQVDYLTIQEDSGPQLSASLVRTETEAPLTVALVLDVSGSMFGDPLNDAQNAAARFLDHLKPGDQAAVIAFGDQVDKNPANLRAGRELGFSGDLDPIYDLVEGLADTSEKTHLYNAATKAARMTANQQPGHRAVLLLTDGRNDPPDMGFPNEAIEIAKDANIPFFVIGLGKEIDEAYLRNLANETGGLFRAAPSSAELGDLFNSMATLLKTQYELTYESQLPADGARHQLTITLNTAGSSASDSYHFGPVPQADQLPTATLAPTEVATETPVAETEQPTETPSLAAPTQTQIIIEPTATSTPVFPPETILGLPLPVWLVGGGGLLLSLFWLLYKWIKGKIDVEGEVCAKCGFDLTGKTGACPQCEHTKRLPKFRQ